MKLPFKISIFFSIFSLLLVCFCGFSFFLLQNLNSEYELTTEKALADFSELIAQQISNNLTSEEINKAWLLKTFKVNTKAKLNFYITNQKGNVLFHSSDPTQVGKNYYKWNDVFLTLNGKYGARSTRLDPQDSSTSVYHIAAPIKYKAKIIGVVSIIKKEESITGLVTSGKNRLIKLTLLALILSSLLAWLLSHFLNIPIRRFREYTESLSEVKPTRPPKFNSKEFTELSNSFDLMRIKLEGKEQIKKYVENLSHEIKSPLTAIQCSSQILKSDTLPKVKKHEFLKNIDQECYRITKLLEDLLVASKLESQHKIKKTNLIDLSILIQEILSSLSPIINSKKIEIIAVGLKQLEEKIQCNKELIEHGFRNVILNAIQFSPYESKILIQLIKTNLYYEITIADQGDGVPDYAHEKIFERYFSLPRPNTNKKSSGMGLNFSKEVFEIHGGSIQIKSKTESTLRLESNEFQGGVFEIKIPVNK